MARQNRRPRSRPRPDLPNEDQPSRELNLYRYRGLADGGLNRVRETLVHGLVYFSSPRAFNDPFDCQVDIDCQVPITTQRSVLQAALRGRVPRRELKRAVTQSVLEGKIRDPERQAALVADMQAHVYSLGVLCLSMHPDHPLMWSHYAHAHSGICLKFQIPEESVLRVDYVLKRPVVKLGASHSDMVRANLLTKADCWRYEDEYRILDTDNGPGLRPINPDPLVGIIFGLRTSDDHKKTLLRWIDRAHRPLEVWQAKQVPGEFRLELSRIQ